MEATQFTLSIMEIIQICGLASLAGGVLVQIRHSREQNKELKDQIRSLEKKLNEETQKMSSVTGEVEDKLIAAIEKVGDKLSIALDQLKTSLSSHEVRIGLLERQHGPED